MAQRGPNLVLQRALAELGWSPYELARQINRVMGPCYVHRTTPIGWCERGVIPNDPLPSVVAGILTEASEQLVPVEELWQGRASASGLWEPATDGVNES